MRYVDGDTKVLEVDRYEQGVLINSLNNERNKLIADGRTTDAVDEVFVKVVEAPSKKRRGRDEAR